MTLLHLDLKTQHTKEGERALGIGRLPVRGYSTLKLEVLKRKTEKVERENLAGILNSPKESSYLSLPLLLYEND